MQFDNNKGLRYPLSGEVGLLSLGKLKNVWVTFPSVVPELVWIEEIKELTGDDIKDYVFYYGSLKTVDLISEPTFIPFFSSLANAACQSLFEKTIESYRNFLHHYISYSKAMGPVFLLPDTVRESIIVEEEKYQEVKLEEYTILLPPPPFWRALLTIPRSFDSERHGAFCYALYTKEALQRKVEYLRKTKKNVITVSELLDGKPFEVMFRSEQVAKKRSFLSQKGIYILVGEQIDFVKDELTVFAEMFVEPKGSKYCVDNALERFSSYSRFQITPDGKFQLRIYNAIYAFAFKLFYMMATGRGEPRACRYCGRIFIPNRKDQFYCSAKCRRQASFEKKASERKQTHKRESQEDT